SMPGDAGTNGTAGTGSDVAGTSGTAGTTGSGGSAAGATGSAGTGEAGGTTGAGGSGAGSGGTTGRGGTVGSGGSSAGTTGTGGSGVGGTTGRGGVGGTVVGRGGSSGTVGTGGTTARGGTTGTGGSAAGTTGTGGSGTGVDGGIVDCTATLPTGGTAHMSSNAQGTAAGMNWSIWTNSGPGTITTFTTPAFAATWGSSGDFLARIGLQFGNSGKAVSALGTVAADYVQTKSSGATGGGYSYIGIYGWSVNPCIEWYIVDDSFNKMPVNPGSTTNKGMATIDGGSYILYTRPTSGTGGSRCSGVSNWTQFYSVRTTSRTCGQITISDHFAAWAAAGMTLGNVLEASILVETGGGSGTINFPIANVTTSM
ncbi:MAG TPA: glycoside hydrolase family 11 protein, partial [Polyangia bacterium]|nr:glycoside hydrolase family 11 protein [Polyangia bacterium]